MDPLFVSLIIPVLNGEKYIARCLTSILNQNLPAGKYEIIVVDNGSTDRTQQIVRSLGVFLHVVPGATVGALRNAGARIARGNYLGFVDSDVEIGSHWLEKGLLSFHDKSVVSSGCFPRPPSPSTWVQEAWGIHQCGARNYASDRGVTWLPSMNLIVRRTAFDAIGGFNDVLVTAEDVDLCYRLNGQGKIVRNPDMEAIHWGEAPDLKTFWRKEVWRGMGTLKGIISHGLRVTELPSVGYPIYVTFGLFFVLISCVFAFQNRTFELLGASIFILITPAITLAIRTATKTEQLKVIPQLFVLYLVYGIARAHSITKGFQRSLAASVASHRRI